MYSLLSLSFRREHRQLMRTVADIFRLVPMIVFLVCTCDGNCVINH